MKIAVDTCVGRQGRALLESTGHVVVVEAEPGEMDHVWFARALRAGVELVVSADTDLEVHCYDHRVEFFRAKQRHSGLLTAQRVLLRYPVRPAGFCRGEGCPRADLCRRHMETAAAENPTYFNTLPLRADGQCGEFVANGWLRGHFNQCGGAHPPPRCVWNCQIELHRWVQRGDAWVWIDGTAN